MRTAYHEQLDDLSNQLGEMCGLAGIAMERATQALLQADLVLAEQVITDHEQIAAMSAKAEEAAFVLLALQAPVAGDLRAIVSSIQIVADVDRMGALALHVEVCEDMWVPVPPSAEAALAGATVLCNLSGSPITIASRFGGNSSADWPLPSSGAPQFAVFFHSGSRPSWAQATAA